MSNILTNLAVCDGPGRIFPALFPVGPFLLRKLLACKPDSEAVAEAVAESCMFKSVMLGLLTF